MLQTSGKESTVLGELSVVDFGWTTKSFIASADISVKDLVENVKFVSVNFTDDKILDEVDTLIESISKDDKEIDRLDAKNKERKARLDEISTQRVKSTRKSNPLMDFLREKWAIAMLPMTVVIFGRKFKATKSKGSVGTAKPDFEKIVETLAARHPKMVKEVEELKRTVLTVPKSTASSWRNFSEIDSEK